MSCNPRYLFLLFDYYLLLLFAAALCCSQTLCILAFSFFTPLVFPEKKEGGVCWGKKRGKKRRHKNSTVRLRLLFVWWHTACACRLRRIRVWEHEQHQRQEKRDPRLFRRGRDVLARFFPRRREGVVSKREENTYIKRVLVFDGVSTGARTTTVGRCWARKWIGRQRTVQ